MFGISLCATCPDQAIPCPAPGDRDGGINIRRRVARRRLLCQPLDVKTRLIVNLLIKQLGALGLPGLEGLYRCFMAKRPLGNMVIV